MSKMFESFVQALFFSGTVGVPKYFLNRYSELGISHIEALLLIQIMGELETNPYPSAQMLAKRMNLETSQVEEMIANLMVKNYLAIEKRWNHDERKSFPSYSITGLINELSERWAIEHVRNYTEAQNHQKELDHVIVKPLKDPTMERILQTFEQELARPLTEIECETISGWVSSNFSEELIIGAFKRGVIAGIRNLRYIDSILREWEKKGLRTLLEVESDDAYFQSRQEKSKSARSNKSSQNPANRKTPTGKYDNFYL
jgi:DNA replication protein